MLAGIASWKNDDSRKALEYWRASLNKSPNPDLERLYGKSWVHLEWDDVGGEEVEIDTEVPAGPGG